jgi:predicted RNase H-like nuclease (RuvC/YqgF family)
MWQKGQDGVELDLQWLVTPLIGLVSAIAGGLAAKAFEMWRRGRATETEADRNAAQAIDARVEALARLVDTWQRQAERLDDRVSAQQAEIERLEAEVLEMRAVLQIERAARLAAETRARELELRLTELERLGRCG